METVCGKNGIIFGGAGGIAMEINKVLLNNGIANLVLVDIQDPHQELEVLMKNHKNVFYEKGSVVDKDFVASVFKKYFNQLGYIDILINASGMLNDVLVDLTIQVNTLGPINSCLEALKYMSKHKGGKGGIIINIASVAGLNPLCFCPIYSTSKYALIGFSRCLMDDSFYQLSGVKVHVLCPGKTQTSMARSYNKDTFLPVFLGVVKITADIVPEQPASKVADGVMIALKDNSNGAIWINDDGKSCKVQMPEIYKFGGNSN